MLLEDGIFVFILDRVQINPNECKENIELYFYTQTIYNLRVKVRCCYE